MSSPSVSDERPTVITNAHFGHIQFSNQPRRFPGEATDTLPPSSPPSSDDEDESEPVADKMTIENLRRVRGTSEQALLNVTTDLEYFEKSRNLTNILTTTIKILEQKIANWELQYDAIEREKVRLQRRVDNIKQVWKMYQETIETLSETQDSLEDLRRSSASEVDQLSREFNLEHEELTAQVSLVSHHHNLLIAENRELQTAKNLLELESDELKYVLAQVEDQLGVPQGSRYVDTIFCPPTSPRPELFKIPPYGKGVIQRPAPAAGKNDKASRYRAAHREELREKERLRRLNNR
ncbi:hypothetical protein PQX77_019913 [Marasmius sp. AFHP31]|nr:hypothetical protein PQX77_019913 [Marasmius sp. AFHP31]